MGLSPILFVIHAVTIGITLNFNDFNGGKNEHGLKTSRVNKP